MVVALSTAVMTMACQACVSNTQHMQAAQYTSATLPTMEMMTAVPSALGTGAMQPRTKSASLHVTEATSPVFASTMLDLNDTAVSPFVIEQPLAFELQREFKLVDVTAMSWTGNDALAAVAAERTLQSITAPRQAERKIAAELAISAPRELTGLNFDVGLAPRIAVEEEGELTAQRVGGEVRIGQNFDRRGETAEMDGWYIFAGADGEALVWDAGESGFSPRLGDMMLTDQVTIGDMQAGISMQRAGGELSFSYIRREVSYSDRNGGFSETEDFAGVSFTMRR